MRWQRNGLHFLLTVEGYNPCGGAEDLDIVIIVDYPRLIAYWFGLLQLLENRRNAIAAIALEAARQTGAQLPLQFGLRYVQLRNVLQLLLLLALLRLRLPLRHLDQYEVIVEQADIRHLITLLLLAEERIQVNALRIDSIVLAMQSQKLISLQCHAAATLLCLNEAAQLLVDTSHLLHLLFDNGLCATANTSAPHTTPVTIALLEDSGEDLGALSVALRSLLRHQRRGQRHSDTSKNNLNEFLEQDITNQFSSMTFKTLFIIRCSKRHKK